jgi:hypothetical protein
MAVPRNNKWRSIHLLRNEEMKQKLQNSSFLVLTSSLSTKQFPSVLHTHFCPCISVCESSLATSFGKNKTVSSPQLSATIPLMGLNTVSCSSVLNLCMVDLWKKKRFFLKSTGDHIALATVSGHFKENVLSCKELCTDNAPVISGCYSKIVTKGLEPQLGLTVLSKD